jgi:3D (Asp-Asp-Asp) domain-containing protein
MSAAVMVAVNCVELTNVVTRALPFHCTTEVLTKLVPFTVRVNAPDPALVVLGERVVITGTGFVAVTLKFTAFDVPPPGVGFVTVTGGVPTVVTSLARIAAVTCVALTNVVTLAVPLKFTTELATKLVPFTVSVNAAEPAVTPVGDKVVIVGTGLFAAVTLKLTEFDVPPPGVGFVTVTGGVPTVVTSAAKIEAVNCVAFTNVVALALPLNFTMELGTKLVPLTVRVNATEPAETPVGDNVVIVGTGLFAAVTLKLTEFDVPPPGAGFVTVIGGVPTVVTSAAKIAAVTCVAFTKVVTLALPLKFTVEVETKLAPFTVNVNAPEPAATLVGESVVTVGTTLFTVNATEFEIPPPGVGFVTVTGSAPALATSVERIVADT